MKLRIACFAVPLVLMLCAAWPNMARAQWVSTNDPNPPTLQKADLPVGGDTVTHPIDKQIVYYRVSSWKIREVAANANKWPGIYGSTDGGQSWKLLSSAFEFYGLFIHPKSGELFAIIDAPLLRADEKGFLRVYDYQKAVSSVDGQNWKDIMGKKQRVAELSSINIDPNHPNRVQLSGHALRPFRYSAIDDNYSDWKWELVPTAPEF